LNSHTEPDTTMATDISSNISRSSDLRPWI